MLKPVYEFMFFLIIGLWMMTSPYVLGFTDMAAAYWNALGIGLLSTVGALLGLYSSWGEGTDQALSHRPPVA